MDRSVTPRNPRRRARLWAGIALIALALAVALAARPGYRAAKRWRASQIAAGAQSLFDQRDLTNAVYRAQAALRLNQQDPQALRVMARALGVVRQPEAFAYWRAALAQGAAEAELFEAIELALTLRRLDEVEPFLTELLARKPEDARALRLAAVFCELRQDTACALHYARLCLSRTPADAEMRLLLCRQLLTGRQAADRDEAKAILWDLTRDPGALPSALAGLAGIPALTPAELQEAIRLAQSLPDERPQAELLRLEFQLRLEPGRREEWIRGVLARHRNADRAGRLELARWLNRHHEHTATLELLPLAESLADTESFLAYLDAAAALGRWRELGELLGCDNLPLEPAIRELFRARTARELKLDRLAALHWAQAQTLAADHPGQLWYLAQYAERVGETDEAMKALRKLAGYRPAARMAYEGLVRLLEGRRDLVPLRAALQEMILIFPQDPSPLNDWSYLSLLLREEMDTARRKAAGLVEQHPAVPAYRVTLALALLRSDDAAGARSQIDRVALDWSQALPGWAAVRAAVLGATGDVAAAGEIAGAIDRRRLKAPELALIEPFLAADGQ